MIIPNGLKEDAKPGMVAEVVRVPSRVQIKKKIITLNEERISQKTAKILWKKKYLL